MTDHVSDRSVEGGEPAPDCAYDGHEHQHAVAASIGHPTNSEFMGRLLAGAEPGSYGWTCAFAGDPHSEDKGKWYGGGYVDNDRCRSQVDGWGELNTYFCVSELREVDGLGGRRKQNFVRLRALPVDDAIAAGILGTPSWSLETSPGKDQTGVFIDPEDPDSRDAALVDAVMQELYRRKLLGDTAGNNLVRYVRLPQGTNGKPRDSGPFRHRLHIWNPEQVLSLADACAVFGIDLDELRPKARAAATDMVLTGEGQDKLMAEALQRIVTGDEYHDSINRVAASMVASGAHPGAVTNLLRAIMASAQAPRDKRWQDRYNDIPRAVATGSRKYQVEPLAAPGEPEAKKPLLTKIGALMASMRPTKWLIHGWVEEGALGMVFGPSNVGKSFIVYDWVFCVGTGALWHGHKVIEGPVVVVIGEGLPGFAKRAAAWSKHRGIDLANAPIYVTDRAVPILDAAQALELVSAIDATVHEAGGITPALIVIDTLARNFGGDGDENSAKDASAFIDVVDTLLRRRYGAAVVIVHHSGHEAGRARGSSALKGAMDQEFSVTAAMAGAIVKLEAKKMKDAEKPLPIDFRTQEVVLGEDDDGNKISSLVMCKATSEWDDVLVDGNNVKVTVGWMLERLVGEFMPSLSKLEQEGVSRNGARKAIADLMERGYLARHSDASNARVRITDAGRLLMSRAGRAVGVDFDADGGAEGAEDA